MDARQELEQLRKLKRLRELEAKAGQKLPGSPALSNAQGRLEYEAATNPTTDMSTVERLAASYGGVLPNAVLGVKQRLTEKANQNTFGTLLSPEQQMTLAAQGVNLDKKLVPDSAVTDVQNEVEERRRLEAPLDNTTAGNFGKVAGNVALMLPTAYLPGANTYQGAAITGGLMGLIQPTAEGESAGINTATGAGFGVAGKAAADILSAILRGGYQGAKSMAAPFYEGGRQKIAANTLRAFASNPDDVAARLAQAKEIVPGSMPTAADVAQDAGVSQLQRAVQASDPQVADDFAQRGLDRNSARLKALKGVTKYGDDLGDAVSRRSAIGDKLYAKAKQEIVDVDDNLQSLMKRPSFSQAMERAKRIAEEEGDTLGELAKDGKVSVKTLHYIKMGMDDLVNEAPKPGNSVGNTELGAIKKTRGALLDWLSDKSPSYKTARTRFEKASRPINREEVVREITSKATRSQTPNVRGEMTLYPSSLGSTLKNEGESVVRQATGRAGKTLPDVMTPDQMKILESILKDASMEQAGVNFGRATGSNTAQNLASMNILRQTTGEFGFPGIQGWAERNVFPSVARGMNLIYGGQEPMIRQSLAQILLDPQKAAQFLQMVPPQQRQLVTSELLKSIPAATGTALAVQ